MRDSDNSYFDFDSADTGVGGITMPHSMKSWFKACGYGHMRDTTSVWILSDASDFDAIGSFFMKGRWVCLFINDNLLDSKTETDRSFSPNHWVVLTSSVRVIDGKTSFSVFSWGQRYQIQQADADDIGTFMATSRR